MNRLLATIFLAGLSLSALAQYGVPPYDFNTNTPQFFESGVGQQGEVMYVADICEVLPLEIFFNSSSDINVYENETLITSGSQNVILSGGGFEYRFENTAGDILFTVQTNFFPATYYDQVELILGDQRDDSLLVICEKSPGGNELFVENQFGNFCMISDLGLGTRVVHNNQTYDAYSFYASNLKDGDSLYVEMETNYQPNYSGLLDCGCYHVPNGIIASKMYYVKTISNPTSTIEVNSSSICPGDTISLEIPNSAATGIKWRGTLSTVNVTKNISTQNNADIITPGNYWSYYKEMENDCYTYSDTFSINGKVDCTHGFVTGRLYDDLDADGNVDYYEVRLKDHFIEVMPSGQVYITGDDGRFGIKVPLNTPSTIKMKENDFWSSDSVITVAFTDPAEWNYVSDDLETWADERDDVEVYFSIGRLRPGFQANATLIIKNIGNASVSVSPRIKLDSNLSLIKTVSGRYLYADGDELYQSAYTVGARSSYKTKFTIQVPADITLLGQSLQSIAWINRADDNVVNNIFEMNNLITGSYDPNDKSLFEAIGSEKSVFITDSTELVYTIRFQNTGSDTAFNVRVEDVISQYLDVYSIEMIDASHDYTMKLKDENKIVWFFDNILLPDSNVNEPNSHGYIKFTINQKSGNADGTMIGNKADIYFDFNPPVITNEIVAMVGEPFITNVHPELNEMHVGIAPNPTSDEVTIIGEYSNVTYKLMTQSGIVMKQGKFDGSTSIDMTSFNEGLYILILQDGVHTKVEKVIRN